jgi:hypothetical protein
MALRVLQPKVLDVFQFIAPKEPLRVIKQTPEPGTPVLQGMTIEIHAVSYSDVPYSVLDPKAPPVIRDIPIAIMDKALASDVTLKAAFETGTFDAGFPTKFIAALNASGFQGTISEPVATTFGQSLKDRLGSGMTTMSNL